MGPWVNDKEKVKELVWAGMNVARLNFSHRSHEEHLEVIQLVKEVRKELDVPLAIMVDTKGPEVRIGEIEGGEMLLNKGQRIWMIKEQKMGNEKHISLRPPAVLDKLSVEDLLLFDNGYISSKVIQVGPEGALIEIHDGGIIRSGKGINIPNVSLDLPFLSEKDRADIIFACRNDIDFIAASFVRSADDVIAVKEVLESENRPNILVIAKIENSEGVNNLDSIVQVADGIMVARGDLGVEVPLTQVPKLQKLMIRKSCLAGKPVITATHMLESMITNPRPTRAETSDVANAIYDSTSAVMLSGETAIGKYPIESVKMMQNILRETEDDFRYRNFFEQHSYLHYHDVPSALTLAAVKTAYSSNATAIFAFTSGGATARLLSRLRPKMPIIAMTPNEKCYHQLSLMWGVIPYLSEKLSSIEEAFKEICRFALENRHVSSGDLVVVTAGTPFGIAGTTNMMIVENIGDVLIRAHSGLGPQIHANVTLVLGPEAKEPYSVRGSLIVVTKCDDSYLPLIKEAAGMILQNHIDDVASEDYAFKICKALNKPVIVRADEASRILKEGQLVTLAPEKALVYKGVVLALI